jgi:hypothetical protein
LGVSCYQCSSKPGKETVREHYSQAQPFMSHSPSDSSTSARASARTRFRVWCSGFLYWSFPSYWDFVLSFFSPSCRDKEDSRRALLTRQSLELRTEDA